MVKDSFEKSHHQHRSLAQQFPVERSDRIFAGSGGDIPFFHFPFSVGHETARA